MIHPGNVSNCNFIGNIVHIIVYICKPGIGRTYKVVNNGPNMIYIVCERPPRYLQFVWKLFMLKFEILNEFLVYIFKGLSFSLNFRTIAAHTTNVSFNGEIRQRTSNPWRLEQQWWLSSQDLLNDLFQQELHHIIIGQGTLSSKR